MLLVDDDEIVVREAGQDAAHGFEFEPEVGPDFRTRHPEYEFAAGVTALLKAQGKIEDEGREPLFGVHGAEKKHHAVLAHDFSGKELLKMRPPDVHALRQFVELFFGEDADFSVFKGN